MDNYDDKEFTEQIYNSDPDEPPNYLEEKIINALARELGWQFFDPDEKAPF